MTISTHIIAATWICQVVCDIDRRLQTDLRLQGHDLVRGILCFLGSLSSHFILDAVPHYTFINYVSHVFMTPGVFRSGVMLVEWAIFTIPVILLCVYLTRTQRIFLCLSLAGGIYPDIEKVAYLKWHLPHWAVLFPKHSCSYSANGWTSQYAFLLSSLEVGLCIVLLCTIQWMTRFRMQ